jgi:putative drug exporter of the RND superfamily
MTERLAAAAARRPWLTIAAWVGAVVLAVAAAILLLPGRLTTDYEITNNPESTRAETLLGTHLPHDPHAFDEVVIVQSRRPASHPAFKLFTYRLTRTLRGADGTVVEPETRLSRDGHALLLPIRLQSDVKPVLDVVRHYDRRPGYAVDITGQNTLSEDFDALSQHDLKSGELQFGMPAALLVLLLVFGAVVAGLVPLVLALVSIAVAVGLTALFAVPFTLSVFVVNMISGMGLALGIDYSLFVLSRYREERVRGRSERDAIAAAGATASRAVLFSGSVFVVALVGMLLVPNSVLKSLALGAILVGMVSVVAALTLLPALLGLLGDRINALRLPFFGRSIDVGGREGRVWGAIVRAVMRRPALWLVAAAVPLLAAAVPILSLKIGHNGVGTVPDRFLAKQGLIALERNFPRANSDPVLIAIDGASAEVSQDIRRLLARLRRDREFGRAQTEVRNGITAVAVPVRGDVEGSAAAAAVRRLRNTYIPESFRRSGVEVLVGGVTADDVDYFDTIRNWLPIVFAFVLGLSLVLLTLVFRSVVVAAKAIALNLLSVGAAYGLLVLVFQKGYLHGFFGFQQVDTIEAWVPLFLFSVLFGLSMDYHVFLLTRIRERFLATGDNDASVEFGIGSTARLITGAALIIVAVFCGFAAGDLVMFQQMGFGVAVSLLVDATIIRSVILPAAMKLLGRGNWYLPRWLAWLPELQVEKEQGRLAAAPVR